MELNIGLHIRRELLGGPIFPDWLFEPLLQSAPAHLHEAAYLIINNLPSFGETSRDILSNLVSVVFTHITWNAFSTAASASPFDAAKSWNTRSLERRESYKPAKINVNRRSTDGRTLNLRGQLSGHFLLCPYFERRFASGSLLLI